MQEKSGKNPGDKARVFTPLSDFLSDFFREVSYKFFDLFTDRNLLCLPVLSPVLKAAFFEPAFFELSEIGLSEIGLAGLGFSGFKVKQQKSELDRVGKGFHEANGWRAKS